MIAILGAVKRETAGLLTQIDKVNQVSEGIDRGIIYGKEIILVRTGAGPKNAKSAIERLCSFYKPDIILSIGWAGGTKEKINYEKLSQGDIVIADAVYCDYNQSAKPISCDDYLYNSACQVLKKNHIRFHTGASLTSTRPLLLSEEKKEAGERHPVVMIEMESYEIALTAEKNKIPFLVIRVITDPVWAEANLGPPKTDKPQKNLDDSIISFLKAV
jgi:adenosylhomocysteine nucleosidase